MYILALPVDQCSPGYCTFLDTRPNLIMEGVFTKILYTHPHFTLNCIYLQVPLTVLEYKTIYPDKSLLYVEITPETKTAFCQLEMQILAQYGTDKHAHYTIGEQLSMGRIKVPENYSDQKVFIKISGIWESDIHYGMTFKFLFGD